MCNPLLPYQLQALRDHGQAFGGMVSRTFGFTPIDHVEQKLAPKYFQTRFIRVFVENVPWLVEKLTIKVLPCVICFMDGVTKDRYTHDKILSHTMFELMCCVG